MKKKLHLLLLSLVILISLAGFSQKSVIHINEMPDPRQWEHFADVEGFVLINEQASQPIQVHPLSREYAPMFGWPVWNTGISSRGGIFGNLDDDPDLEIVYCLSTKVYARKKDGSHVNGWPQNVNSSAEYGAPAYGDIDGDGSEEIVVACRAPGTGNTGQIYAFKKDGTALTGFPIYCDGGPTKTPVLADLDNDGAHEIIVELRKWPDGKVIVYKGDASTMNGWPQLLDYIPASAVAVGDITGDDIPEIVAESYYKIWAFDANGNVIQGFPYTPPAGGVFSYSSPVLADIDGDGFREIVVGDHSLTNGSGAIHIIKNDGSSLPGWPKFTGNWIYGPASVADIDGDTFPDILVGDQVLSVTPTDYVYGWNRFGNNLPGFPIGPIDAVNCQIIVADMDGDGLPELVFDDNTGNGILNGYNHDGTIMEGWPLSVLGSSFFTNAMVMDVEGDGTLNLSATSYISNTNTTYKYLWESNVLMNDELAVLPVLQYNVRHTGVYGDVNNPTVSIPETKQPNALQADCFPNPCADETTVLLNLKLESLVQIQVMNENGILIQQILPEKLQEGHHRIVLRLDSHLPGLYIVKIVVNGASHYIKLFRHS
ncbi:MAG: T9SS type A sorting domain-containing protein [Bacteroidales bacterium]|nr:T9SS type A sorting domain-containing protein [Bacteroidales bacterium]